MLSMSKMQGERRLRVDRPRHAFNNKGIFADYVHIQPQLKVQLGPVLRSLSIHLHAAGSSNRRCCLPCSLLRSMGSMHHRMAHSVSLPMEICWH